MKTIQAVQMAKMTTGVVGPPMAETRGFHHDLGTMRIMVTAITTWTHVEIFVTTVGALIASRTDHTSDHAKRMRSPTKVTGVEVRVNIPLLGWDPASCRIAACHRTRRGVSGQPRGGVYEHVPEGTGPRGMVR